MTQFADSETVIDQKETPARGKPRNYDIDPHSTEATDASDTHSPRPGIKIDRPHGRTLRRKTTITSRCQR